MSGTTFYKETINPLWKELKSEAEKYLITADELVSGRKGFFAKTFSRFLMSVLKLNRANRLYSDTYYSEDYTGELLSRCGISYDFPQHESRNVPAEGPLIVICNHPTGAMDGIVLIDALTRIRPDVKFMGNFLLNRIEPLRKNIIAVDPFDSRTRSTNMKGIKESIEFLEGGGLLAIFPAGEVATWQDGFRDIKDRQWEEAVLKFIRRCEVPVLPLFIKARNSTFFRLVGKIDPRLRTAMLPRELFNKKGKKVRVFAGTPISPSKTKDLDERLYGNYLRASVDYLEESSVTDRRATATVDTDLSGIAPRPELEAMEREMAQTREYLLFESADQALFCVPSSKIPNIMTEIGRLREITFRGVGEGTMKPLDTDAFDTYYRQLFLWDKNARGLVGGYRMGFGDEIMREHGIRGFYVDTLFRYTPEIGPVLGQSIELGRSFIVTEYQKKPNSLLMLWKGIIYVLLKHAQFRYLMGPVTISGEFTSASKMVLATWLRGQFYNQELGRYVRPVTGMKGIKTGIDLSLIEGIRSPELIAKLVLDIEHEERTMPVLVKKYLGLNSSVLGFNVDPDFADGLDALMLLDKKNIPDATITMLSKELGDMDVAAMLQQPGKE